MLLFTKEELVNLSYSLDREILRTSLFGTYASSSLCFCNTRKYHGLLNVLQPKIDDEYHIILSSLDETIIKNDTAFNLALHRYPNEVYSPKGHKYLQSLEINKSSEFHYCVADIDITKELLISQSESRLFIKYSVKKAKGKFMLKLRPLLAFRQRHKLSKANDRTNTDYNKIENGASFRLYDEYEDLFLQFSKKDISYIHNPQWYYNFEYIRERERGYDFNEDLLSPGEFEVELKKGDILIFTASMNIADASTIIELYDSEYKDNKKIKTYEDWLKRAAKMFFVENEKGLDIIAGFPWFGRWGRDTFISLPGLCVGLKNKDYFKRVIDTIIKDMQGGLFPNIGSGNECAYNSVDAPMWFFWALQKYVEYTGKGKEVWIDYKEIMQSILVAYRDGTSGNIKMLENGMIWAGEDGKALTWMDAVVQGEPITQRKGMCVEINALWYNAIMFSLELAKKAKDTDFILQWQGLAEKLPQEFKATFWDKNIGWLADYVDGYHKDFSVRPNMVIATSLPYRCISDKICQLILYRIEKELLTPFGLRTLSPTHPDYKDRYEGSQEERDRAYHQGTVWVWLLGHFVEGYLRLHKENGLTLAEKIYRGFEESIKNYGVGMIAEIFDGNPPHKDRGSISQAWSVAEIMRIRYMLDKIKKGKG